ncbi:unnamed protein product [Rhizoctonia solani]|uniref:Uncharacterized protein n=1 Tax=Rhizoctonia solani TaxID=456999 RepID=A0A8H3DFS8_9AGAM
MSCSYEHGSPYIKDISAVRPTSLILQMSSTTLPAASPWLAFGGLVIFSIYWLRRPTILVKLPGPSGGSWVYGHFMNLMGAKGIEYQEELFSKYGPTTVIKGFLGASRPDMYNRSGYHSHRSDQGQGQISTCGRTYHVSC